MQNPLLLGACALAFDTGGRFGGDLFAADILNERILRITSAGAVSVFATGFANLAGSGCLAFGATARSTWPTPARASRSRSPAARWRRGRSSASRPRRSPRTCRPAAAAGLELAPPAPNPARGARDAALHAAGGGPRAARRLRRRRPARGDAGGRDARRGRARGGVGAAGGARPGLYFARLEAAGARSRGAWRGCAERRPQPLGLRIRPTFFRPFIFTTQRLLEGAAGARGRPRPRPGCAASQSQSTKPSPSSGLTVK